MSTSTCLCMILLSLDIFYLIHVKFEALGKFIESKVELYN